MSDFEVRGAGEFLKLSKALKAAGQTEMRKELHRGMKQAAKPLVKDAKEAAKDVFPKSGGLAAREAKVRFRPQVRTGETAGVSIVAPGNYVAAKTTNANGTFKHPVFGKRRWVSQRVGHAGWFDDAMHRGAPRIRHELEQALQRVADTIVRGAGRG